MRRLGSGSRPFSGNSIRRRPIKFSRRCAIRGHMSRLRIRSRRFCGPPRRTFCWRRSTHASGSRWSRSGTAAQQASAPTGSPRTEPMAVTPYDVLIIGSGASGGMAAWNLTQKGLRCLMLDAGPPMDYEKDRVLKPVYELPYRGFGKPGRFPHVTQASEFNGELWADEKQN